MKELQQFHIGIAGAGGLGSNAAIALVRSDVKNLTIADFDCVAESNLNRQYYFADQIGKPKVEALRENIFRIYSDVNLKIHFTKVTPHNFKELYADCDLIIEAFDKAEEKVMLIEEMMKYFPEKPLIIGSGLAGWGRSNDIRMEQIGNIIICGDSISEIGEHHPPLAPRVGMTANMQANEALRILLGMIQ
ncbi:MAG: sulfur carrier protein ThiS adenylyltransferase ThiF [Bacteroidales bacterium]|jgi:sulfur carrier protein ThiS adenylyltransferase|nr:sulfur carrier protein ThiS adenylyltransferase ThiF [Bacteroidales bacterium]